MAALSSANQWSEAEKMAKQLGMKMEKSNTAQVSGTYQDGTLQLNSASSTPVQQVLSHDLVQYLKNRNQFTALQANALAYSAKKEQMQIDQMQEQLAELYEESGISLTKKDINMELTLMFCQNELFTNEPMMVQMAKNNPALFRQMGNWLQSAKKRLKGTEQEDELLYLELLYEDIKKEAVR